MLRSLTILLFLTIPLVGQAITPDPATDAVRHALGKAQGIVGASQERSDKLAGLRGLSRELFDTEAMALRAIGSVLDQRPANERAEFLELFDVFIVRAYLQKLLFFREPRFGFARPEVEDEFTLVKTAILSADEKYYVNYEMREREGLWRANEVIVEGIGLIDNYREQFTSVLEASSFEELLEMMRRKTRRLRAKEDK